jgi:alpha-beta hydrolase superfamily lysophospholipase
VPAIASTDDTTSSDAVSRTFEPELRRVAANGIEINVAFAGEGPAVLLLHGFPHTWQLWSPAMGALAAQYRVIAPDLRGFGASTRAANGYDAATLATDAEALLGALGETRPPSWRSTQARRARSCSPCAAPTWSAGWS